MEAIAGAQEVRVLSESPQVLHCDHNCVLLDFAFRMPGSEGSDVNQSSGHGIYVSDGADGVLIDISSSVHFQKLPISLHWILANNGAAFTTSQGECLSSFPVVSIGILPCSKTYAAREGFPHTLFVGLLQPGLSLHRGNWRESIGAKLLERAAAGDVESIRQATRDTHSKHNLDVAIGRFGSRANLARAVHEHFSSKFDAPPVQSPECLLEQVTSQSSEAGNQHRA